MKVPGASVCRYLSIKEAIDEGKLSNVPVENIRSKHNEIARVCVVCLSLFILLIINYCAYMQHSQSLPTLTMENQLSLTVYCNYRATSVTLSGRKAKFSTTSKWNESVESL